MRDLIPARRIGNKIYLIRGQKVMLDRDLAELYGVNTAQLKRQVKRNRDRFPGDFMFVLNEKEIRRVVCQIGIPSKSYFGGSKPFAFTEHGILMLSSVLKSSCAVQINIQIMRIFTRLRRILSTHKELAEKLKELEQKVENHDSEIKGIFEAIRLLVAPEKESKKKIGFLK